MPFPRTLKGSPVPYHDVVCSIVPHYLCYPYLSFSTSYDDFGTTLLPVFPTSLVIAQSRFALVDINSDCSGILFQVRPVDWLYRWYEVMGQRSAHVSQILVFQEFHLNEHGRIFQYKFCYIGLAIVDFRHCGWQIKNY